MYHYVEFFVIVIFFVFHFLCVILRVIVYHSVSLCFCIDISSDDHCLLIFASLSISVNVHEYVFFFFMCECFFLWMAFFRYVKIRVIYETIKVYHIEKEIEIKINVERIKKRLSLIYIRKHEFLLKCRHAFTKHIFVYITVIFFYKYLYIVISIYVYIIVTY